MEHWGFKNGGGDEKEQNIGQRKCFILSEIKAKPQLKS